jgi:hypothetical protein
MTSDDFKLARATFVTDVVKHISTLASGSILLLATFLGRGAKPLDKGTLTTAVVLLLACIVCCSVHLFFFGIIKMTVVESEVSGRAKQRSYALLGTLIVVTFVLGMIFLGISVIRTL